MLVYHIVLHLSAKKNKLFLSTVSIFYPWFFNWKKKNSVFGASTPKKNKNLTTPGGMNYTQAICIIWMGSPENQLKQLCNQSLNTNIFPHVHTDIIDSEYGTIIIRRADLTILLAPTDCKTLVWWGNQAWMKCVLASDWWGPEDV